MRSANRKWIPALVALAGSASITSAVLGDNWMNAAGGSWGVGANWSNNVVPTTATFDLGSAGYTVTLPSNESLTSLVVQTDNPVIALNSNTLFVQLSSPPPSGQLQIAPTRPQARPARSRSMGRAALDSGLCRLAWEVAVRELWSSMVPPLRAKALGLACPRARGARLPWRTAARCFRRMPPLQILPAALF